MFIKASVERKRNSLNFNKENKQKKIKSFSAFFGCDSVLSSVLELNENEKKTLEEKIKDISRNTLP